VGGVVTTRVPSSSHRPEPGVTELSVDVIAGPDGSGRLQVVTGVVKPDVTCNHVKELLDPGCWGYLTEGRLMMRRIRRARGNRGPSSPAQRCQELADYDDTWPSTDLPLPGDELVDDEPVLYQEVFTIARGLYLTPLLVCQRRWLPYGTTTTGTNHLRARALEYRMADEQSADELLRVDQGSIVLRETDDGLRITTTKRVRSVPPLDGPGLSISIENLGYLTAFERMVAAAVALGRRRVAESRGPSQPDDRAP
jgi:hypothetical protein